MASEEPKPRAVARGSWIDINSDLFKRERGATEWDHVSSTDLPSSREGSITSHLSSTGSLLGVADVDWEEEDDDVPSKKESPPLPTTTTTTTTSGGGGEQKNTAASEPVPCTPTAPIGLRSSPKLPTTQPSSSSLPPSPPLLLSSSNVALMLVSYVFAMHLLPCYYFYYFYFYTCTVLWIMTV
jgi:hypothetical protein